MEKKLMLYNLVDSNIFIFSQVGIDALIPSQNLDIISEEKIILKAS